MDLELQANQLEDAFKKFVLQLGIVLRFHTDVINLGIQNYAPNAPTTALKAAIKRYDSVCSAIEQNLLLAKAVLERDLRRAQGLSPLTEIQKASPDHTSVKGFSPALGQAIATDSPLAAPSPAAKMELSGLSPSVVASVFDNATQNLSLPATIDPTLPDLNATMDLDALLASFDNPPAPLQADSTGPFTGLPNIDYSDLDQLLKDLK